MSIRWNRKSGVEADIAAIAAVLRDSGNDSQLLGEALATLPCEQRVAVLSKVIDSLPPLVRGLVWGSAGLTADTWPEVAATLTQEERRPRIVGALVERGRETRSLDLAKVPANTELRIDLYSAGYMATPEVITTTPSDGYVESLVFTALGDGMLDPQDDVYVRSTDQSLQVQLPRGRRMTLGSMDTENAFVQRLAFGRPLWIDVPDHGPTEFLASQRSYLCECNVGMMALDNQPVFRQ
ncbi:MAG TPA: hypothetical protein VLF43_02915 [Candidatus Saccharimonadales bacterium]|nr:hypothetical protein [Candidatus Saccharimonadales bacterium]